LPVQNRGNLNPDGHAASNESPSTSNKKERSLLPFILTFFIMFVFWLFLSGRFDLFHISLGVISSALVALFSGDLLFDSPRIKDIPRLWLRFLIYIPWLLYQIFLANLHLLYLTFHPKLLDLIDPKIIRFRSKLRHDLSLVTFANSITLTPGTITVYVTVDGDFTVHTIDKKSSEGLPGLMEERIARAFGEG